MVLNVLLYADFSIWPQTQLKQVIDYLGEISQMSAAQNRILLAYNPILTICLSCLVLSSIGKAIAAFLSEADNLKNDLISLGSKIVENMEDENVRPTFMD